MLNSITWTDYIIVVLLLVATYYLCIGVRFYSKDIRKLLLGKNKSEGHLAYENCDSSIEQTTKTDLAQYQIPFDTSSENIIEQVENIANSLKEAIEESVKKQMNKEELIYALRLKLKDHTALKDSPFQSAINELISIECKKLGFPNLDENEMMKMWG